MNDPIITYNLATKDFNEEIDDDTNDTFIVNGFVGIITTPLSDLKKEWGLIYV